MTKEEYFKQLDECQEQIDELWEDATHEDMHLTDPLGWL